MEHKKEKACIMNNENQQNKKKKEKTNKQKQKTYIVNIIPFSCDKCEIIFTVNNNITKCN